MGPFNVIGNISFDQQWAHSMSSAMFLKNNKGPIQCRRPVFSWAGMGLPTVIDSISHEQQWAHSMTRQPYLSIHMSYNWPIHCHRQYFLWQQWAHSILLATFPLRSNGPIQCPRPVLSRAGMGPSTVISSISHEQQWAHSMSSAACLGSYNGSTHDIRQHYITI